MNRFDNIPKIPGLDPKMLELTKMAQSMSSLSKNLANVVGMHHDAIKSLPVFDIPKFVFPKIDIPDFSFINSQLLESLTSFTRVVKNLNNNPEVQFAFISDLEILNLKSAEELKASLTFDLADEDIEKKENLLNENLLPYLEKHDLDSLWIGANKALEAENNPDRLRQCLISLRTILEYLIDEKLAPIEKLKDSKMFEAEFKKYHLGKKKLEFIKIRREQKIEYFTSKFKFGLLEEFTKNEIQYVCDCYSILCNIHQPNIGITENQVRSLKVKTGITIWLLIYLFELLED
ncbi:hypothetical protein [Flavobacterium terrisoli]|uniref:pPIWI-associating nuclease domain-containing protein n=1 Tax=Flavobacterium terrisoli TaxID=3242195 RepID=UPI0025433023|nr:hypothetical protein [Flavobacterium buctense]